MCTDKKKKWDAELVQAWKDNTLKYPTIRRTEEGMVVLFSEECVGTVVKKATSGDIIELGTYMVNWIMSDFGCTVIPVHILPNDCNNCKYELGPDENGKDICHKCIEFSKWRMA